PTYLTPFPYPTLFRSYVARLLEDIANSRRQASELGCALGFTQDDTVDSIYLGGGTPSLLDAPQLLRIFAAVREQFAITPDAEIRSEEHTSELQSPDHL